MAAGQEGVQSSGTPSAEEEKEPKEKKEPKELALQACLLEVSTAEATLEPLAAADLQLTGEPLEIVGSVEPDSTLTVALPLSGATEGPITGDINFTLGNLYVQTVAGQTTASIRFDSALMVVGTTSLVGTLTGGIDLNISGPQLLLQPLDPDVSVLPGGDPTVTEIGASFAVDLTNLPDGAALDVTFAKDTAALLSEPGSKFLLLADSVGGQLGDLSNDVAFGINVVKIGIGDADLGDTEVTLEVSKAWFDAKISEGKRIFIGKFNDAGDPVPPPQDVTDSCTANTDPVVCGVTLTGAQGSLSVFALAAITVPVKEEVIVELHTIDQLNKTGASKTPVSGAKVKVFDRDVLNGLVITLLDGISQVSLTKNPDGSLYPDIFESFEATTAQVSSCTTGADGHATCTEGAPGNYLVLVEVIDSSGKTVIAGKPKSLEELVDGNQDGNIDLITHSGICFDSSQNPLLDTNGDWSDNDCDGVLDTGATKEFQIIKVIRKETDQFGEPIVQLGRGSKRVVVGSYLEIIFPEFAIWEEGVTSYLYPFILTSDTEWIVDVCAEVPAGYGIIGVYDEFGTLVETAECIQTVVANTKLVVAFEVVDLASPPPVVTAKFKLRGPKGQLHNFNLRTRGHRKGKDILTLLSEPGSKFLLIGDSVDGQLGELSKGLDVGTRLVKIDSGNLGAAEPEVTLEASKAWFDANIAEGQRILVTQFNDAGEPIPPHQDLTNTCTSVTDRVICKVALSGHQESLSASALAVITVPNNPPVATADFSPINVLSSEGTFSVVATGTDPDGDPTALNAVIATPSTRGLELTLTVSDLAKVAFDTVRGKLDIKGPDPQAIMDLLQELNGFKVDHEQVLKIELAADKKFELFVQTNGTLNIQAPQVTLEVTAKDTFGASDTATATPIFPPVFTSRDAVSALGTTNTSPIPDPIDTSVLQPVATSRVVFSETKTQLIADKEIRIETPDGQAALIVPSDFLPDEVVGQIVELELKNLDPATVEAPKEGVQLIRAVEVNGLIQGQGGSLKNIGPVVLVIPLTLQDIANVQGDLSTLEVHRLDLGTGAWELLPTTLNDSAGPLRLMVTLEEFGQSTISISQPIPSPTQSESPPALGPVGGITPDPASTSAGENGWPGKVIIAVSAGAIGLMLVPFPHVLY